MRARWRPAEWSLAQQLLVFQAAIVLVVFLIAAGVALFDARRDAHLNASQRVIGVAEAVARSAEVAAAVQAVTAAPETAAAQTTIQAYAEEVRIASGTDFVVVMTPSRLRLSHPNQAQLGKLFLGNIDQALQGQPFTETYTGTLGPSVRAVVPVRSGGNVVGLVSVGITIDKIGQEYLAQLPAVLGVAAFAFALTAAGTFAVSRRLRRQTHGLGPKQITRMYEYWDAVLHSIREGLIVLDREQRIQLANDGARTLLDLRPDAVGGPVSAAALPPSLLELAVSGRDAVDEAHIVGLHTVVVNQRPAVWEGRVLGTVITLRDRTELTELTGELDSIRGFAEALRAQTHEAANRLHTVVALVELGRAEDAVLMATEELRLTQELADQVLGAVNEPVLSALLLGKASQAHERGVEFVVTTDTRVQDTVIDPRALVTVVGNLIDNAIEAALAAPLPRYVKVTAMEDNGELLVRVCDSGPGLQPEQLEQAVKRGWSTKAKAGRGLGLALVDQVVRRYDGTISVSSDGPTVFEVRLPVAAVLPV